MSQGPQVSIVREYLSEDEAEVGALIALLNWKVKRAAPASRPNDAMKGSNNDRALDIISKES